MFIIEVIAESKAHDYVMILFRGRFHFILRKRFLMNGSKIFEFFVTNNIIH